MLIITLSLTNILSLVGLTLVYFTKNRILSVEKIKNAHLEGKIMLMTKVEQELFELKQKLLNKEEEISKLIITKTELKVTLNKERNEKEKEVELLKKAEERLKNSFKVLSSEALQVNNNAFLSLAKEVIDSRLKETENDLNKRQAKINDIVIPIKEKLEKFDSEIKELEKTRAGAYEGLKEQVSALMQQTSNLANALKKPHVRGRWGEMQLKRVVEMAGMIEYCDFLTQHSVTGKNDNLLRPDLIINMPSGKKIIVDAKVPLDFYLDAVEQNELEAQKNKLKDHAQSVKKHLFDLSKKEYWNQFESTPEFVVLFLTGEGVFSAALEHEPSLIEIGVEKKVLIATPITLIALLRAVAYGWKQETIAENAKKISELGHMLYERLCTMSENFDHLRRSLKSTVDNYNKTVGSLEGRVFPAAREFSKLGISYKEKGIKPAEELENLPRNLHSSELHEENI